MLSALVAAAALMAANGATAAPPAAASPPNAVASGAMPTFAGATGWLNSRPLTTEGLRGKVVVIDFWTYSCINCLRSIPYVNAWYAKYKDSGLVIIGVHSPEFAFEKDTGNVRDAIEKFGIRYPVALDSSLAIWKAYNNRFWPAHYFIDAKGQIRGHHFGEGKYDRSEQTIRKLLVEAGVKKLPEPIAATAAAGVHAASNYAMVKSPETYLGFARGANFKSPGSFARDALKSYELPKAIGLNEWALAGRWKVDSEKAHLAAAGGRIAFRFKARDLHLVLGPGSAGKPVRFKVLLDGKPPGADRGMDIDAAGVGIVKGQRLYQLIRQRDAGLEREFTIEFLDADVEAYSFTFG